MYTLHIGNKNYSSWSLRPWALMRALGIPFTEVLHHFGDSFAIEAANFAPAGKVPCLVDGTQSIWDSLAIIEYLAERHPDVWPTDAHARAWARCASAEMHSGFGALRSQHGMNIGVRVAVAERTAAILADIARIESLWNEGISRFGGPYLAGKSFSAVDAFFAPVAFRFRTYGVPVSGTPKDYMATLLSHPVLAEWESSALAEDFRDIPHDAELQSAGTVIADLRAAAK